MPNNDSTTDKQYLGTADEVKSFHPLVEQWLIENNYTVEHHKTVPNYGIVDFYATHNTDNTRLVIECKCRQSAIAAGIQQAIWYAKELDSLFGVFHVPCIAFPSQFKLARPSHQKCESNNVTVIKVDGYIEPSEYNYDPFIDGYKSDVAFTAAFVYELARNPQSKIDLVVEFHKDKDSSPLYDLIELWEILKSEIYRHCNRTGKEYQKEVIPYKNYFLEVLNVYSDGIVDACLIVEAVEIFPHPTIFKKRIFIKSPKEMDES